MGDPKKFRKKYTRPGQLWNKERIEEEQALISEYGLVNKREIWKSNSELRNYFDQAKRLIAVKTQQSEKEKKQLLEKLSGLGLLRDKNLEAVLDIKLKNVLDRRLQSVTFRKGIALSIKQARQMITHGHISVGDKKVTAPSYLVKTSEEANISITSGANFQAPQPKPQIAEATQ